MTDNHEITNVIPDETPENLTAREEVFTANEQEAIPEGTPEPSIKELIAGVPSLNELFSDDSSEELPEGELLPEEQPGENQPAEPQPAETQPEEGQPLAAPEEAEEEQPEAAPEEAEEEQPEAAPEEAEEEKPAPPRDPSLYHNRYYLLYGDEKEPACLNTKGTIDFLESIGVTGGELGKARRGKDLSAIYEILTREDDSAQHCSYCGCPIQGAEYYQLKDGRLRCTSCTRTQVKTAEELKEVFERVKNNLLVFFGADMNVPVKVEMLDERKLKRKLKKGLDDPDNNSMLVLGVAVNKGGAYTIYLENGAPRITVIATLVHEMTHIWQYTHWNEKEILSRYGARKRLFIYEGMAMWTEIQYLYLIGETGTAKRDEQETAGRKDEYGVGFNAYSQVYPIERAGMNCADTPFGAGNNPLQF